MKEYGTAEIRNVVLVGHGSVGKTQFSEAMLFKAGAVSRLGRVEDGTTASDFDPDEVKRKISVNLSLIPCEWSGRKLNILDTPGYADFVGEVKCGMRAADAAIIVVCGSSGVQVGTEQVWSYADERNLPRLIVINRMDRENADFFQTLSQLQSLFGHKCVPLHLPIGSQATFSGIVDLLTMKAYVGENGEEQAIPSDLEGVAQEQREKLVEVIAESDDALINKYLEGEELTLEELQTGIRAGVLSGGVVPVLTGSGAKAMGVANLLDAIAEILPSPIDSPTGSDGLSADPKGALAALAFKTTADPYVGRLNYLRVYSGTLASDSQVWNANRERAERIGQLYHMRGKNQEAVPQLLAGDIGAVAKLAETHTGDTLCLHEKAVILSGIDFPEPAYSAAVYPKTKADLDKMSGSLTRMVEEDPTLRVARNADTAETIVSGLGESHVQVSIEKLARKFSLELNVAVPKVPYKETVIGSAISEYIHKKQTGGHGQYARVAIEIQPLPRGEGFQFEDKIVGGVVPRQYIPSVEKGVIEGLHEGVLAGFPVTDIKVRLVDGKDHPVDSSDIAFKIAGAMAFKKGAQDARPVLLEPIVDLKITVPDSYTGDIISDLNGRRARVHGMIPAGNGHTVIEAQVPLAETQRYATDLRSITQGRGSFSMGFSHYEEVPQQQAQRVIDEAQRAEAQRA